MTARERFRKIMRYEKTDALPVLLLEPYEGDGLANWRRQGLPEGTLPEDYLRMDRLEYLSVSFGPDPPFEKRILSEDAVYRVETDGMGTTVRRRKDFPGMYYGHIDHPVKSLFDWRAYSERFKADPRRHGDLEEMAKKAAASDMPVVLYVFPFFMRIGFYGMGMERFLTAFYDSPSLVHEMFGFWGEFVLETIKPVLRVAKPDVVSFGEDLAFKNGPHFSPEIYREFWLPYQNRIVGFVKDAGVENVCMYTSGNFRALLPLMMENGFNLTWPLDLYSGMDPVGLRREYGRGLRLAGGVGKQTLLGGRDAIDRELERLSPLMEEGGFLPAPDDMVPPEMPFEDFCYLVERLRAIRL